MHNAHIVVVIMRFVFRLYLQKQTLVVIVLHVQTEEPYTFALFRISFRIVFTCFLWQTVFMSETSQYKALLKGSKYQPLSTFGDSTLRALPRFGTGCAARGRSNARHPDRSRGHLAQDVRIHVSPGVGRSGPTNHETMN